MYTGQVAVLACLPRSNCRLADHPGGTRRLSGFTFDHESTAITGTSLDIENVR